MTPQEKLAKILRTTPKVILSMEEKMSKITKKTNVIDDLIKENQKRIKRVLTYLDCKKIKAKNIRYALMDKLKNDDQKLYKLFKKPETTTNNGLKTLFNFARKSANIGFVYALKKEKAEEILRKNPPLNIIKAFKYKNIEELLEKEDLIEVFCALRFIESNKWMHEVFNKTYKKLDSNDFEKREVDLRVLSEKWLSIAKKFIKKKHHNISHLKELGVIFIIPLEINGSGETLRTFSLILHYLHELEFYSKLFEKASKESNFGKKIISLLKGEVLKGLPREKSRGINWLIIQRYLAKDNKDDPRLFIPHINPEALHWKKAEQDIEKFSKKFQNIYLQMWLELDWVGDFFDNKKGKELVSFDLVDNAMALVKKEQEIKYLYHHQEALWNKIFRAYMGDKNLEKLMVENFNKGYISL